MEELKFTTFFDVRSKLIDGKVIWNFAKTYAYHLAQKLVMGVNFTNLSEGYRYLNSFG